MLELTVAEDDVGKVIGRGGRTVTALRTVMRACGTQAGPPRARRRRRLTAEARRPTVGRVGRAARPRRQLLRRDAPERATAPAAGDRGRASPVSATAGSSAATGTTAARSCGSSGIADRDAAGRRCAARRSASPRPPRRRGRGEWLVADLVGCRVEGLGEVRRVLAGPVVRRARGRRARRARPARLATPSARRPRGPDVIEVDRGFLGLEADDRRPGPGPRRPRRP